MTTSSYASTYTYTETGNCASMTTLLGSIGGEGSGSRRGLAGARQGRQRPRHRLSGVVGVVGHLWFVGVLRLVGVVLRIVVFVELEQQ